MSYITYSHLVKILITFARNCGKLELLFVCAMHVCNVNSLQVHCLNINRIWHWLLNCSPKIGLACSVPYLAVCIGPSFLFGFQRSSCLLPDTGEQESVNQLCPWTLWFFLTSTFSALHALPRFMNVYIYFMVTLLLFNHYS